MTHPGRAQFWFGLAAIYAIVVGTVALLSKNPLMALPGAGLTFFIVLAVGGLMSAIPPEK